MKTIKWICDDRLINKIESEKELLSLVADESYIRIEIDKYTFIQVARDNSLAGWYLEESARHLPIREIVVSDSSEILPIIEKFERRYGYDIKTVSKNDRDIIPKYLLIFLTGGSLIQTIFFVANRHEDPRILESLVVNILGSLVVIFSGYCCKKDLFFGRFFDASRDLSPMNFWSGLVLSVAIGVALQILSFFW